MEKLYPETKRCLLSVNEQLGKFESVLSSDDQDFIQTKIDDLFREIQENLNQLDIYVTKEPATRKYDSKLKVDQVKYDFQHYRTAYKSIQYRKNQKKLEEKRREELLRSTNVSSISNHVQICLENDQNEVRNYNRMNRTNNELDRMIAHGEQTLTNLKEQNSALKFIKTKMLNVTNSLGLSNTLIRMIERRNRSDKFVLYGGMIITLFIMFLTLKYIL